MRTGYVGGRNGRVYDDADSDLNGEHGRRVKMLGLWAFGVRYTSTVAYNPLQIAERTDSTPTILRRSSTQVTGKEFRDGRRRKTIVTILALLVFDELPGGLHESLACRWLRFTPRLC